MKRSSRRAVPARARSGATPKKSGAPSPAKSTPRRTLPDVAVLGLVLVAAFVMHAAAVRVPFFADDYLFLDQVRNHSLGHVITERDPIGNFFRPVSRQLWFWTLASASHESPFVFHAANLILFLASVALLFLLVRRFAGSLAAAVASGYLALHYASDVPIRWASGSQDLLALTFALATLVLYLAGRRSWAALALVVAMLSKETVILTPLVAILADAWERKAWKPALTRAWPLGGAVLVWLAMWLATAHQRGPAAAALTLTPTGPLAALAHLVQVAIGVEWAPGHLHENFTTAPPWLALIPVLAAVWWASSRTATKRTDPARPGAGSHVALVVGGALALAGTVPVAAVIGYWSSYFYLFALCGAALVFGWLADRGPRWAALALVGALAWGSAGGRALPEFSTGPGPWTSMSHVNRFYFERATTRVASYLDDLKRQRPSLPKGSTVFFAGLPAFVAWQAADGPLVRWAYRDSSLRSYYLGSLTLARARRGANFFFIVKNDTLFESRNPEESLRVTALAMLLSENLDPSAAALTLHREMNPGVLWSPYWLAWIHWARGDTTYAKELLTEAKVELNRGPCPVIPVVLQLLAAGDTLRAFNLMIQGAGNYGLDPRAHGLLSDIAVMQIRNRATAQIEAFAARVLTPESPIVWYRWGLIEAQAQRIPEAQRAFEKYFALGGTTMERDLYARQVLAQIKRAMPGGDLAQEGLRKAGVGPSR